MSTYYAYIKKCNEDFLIGIYKNKYDANNMLLMAKTFENFNNFKKWYKNRIEIYNKIIKKCINVKIDPHKIIQSIYDGYYEDLYGNFTKLEEYIDDFKNEYERE
mgnify:CR=1 FL=1